MTDLARGGDLTGRPGAGAALTPRRRALSQATGLQHQHVETQLIHYDAHTCPHCPGLKGTCCECRGTRAIRMPAKVIAAVAFAWARPGCRCDACRDSGHRQPQGDAWGRD